MVTAAISQAAAFGEGAIMFLSWKEKAAIALIVVAGGLLLSYFSTRPHNVSTLPGVEGTWDCPPNATTSSTVCIKRIQP
jgi:hypothetical protein